MKKVDNLTTNILGGNKALLVTEGRTDWKHFKLAFISSKENGLFKYLISLNKKMM